MRAEVWKERGEEADQREIGADVKDERDAVVIGDFAEEGGAEAAQTEEGFGNQETRSAFRYALIVVPICVYNEE